MHPVDIMSAQTRTTHLPLCLSSHCKGYSFLEHRHDLLPAWCRKNVLQVYERRSSKMIIRRLESSMRSPQWLAGINQSQQPEDMVHCHHPFRLLTGAGFEFSLHGLRDVLGVHDHVGFAQFDFCDGLRPTEENLQ